MGTENKDDVKMVKTKPTIKRLVARFLALALTLVAAVVLGVDRQTTTVSLTLVTSLPPVDVPVTAKWTHLSAFLYFVIANGIACFYAAMSLIIILLRSANTRVSFIVLMLDVVIVALLFSAIGATGSVGIIGYQGNSHLQWEKVCNVFDKFCHQVAVAVFMSFAGSISFLVLIVFTVIEHIELFNNIN